MEKNVDIIPPPSLLFYFYNSHFFRKKISLWERDNNGNKNYLKATIGFCDLKMNDRGSEMMEGKFYHGEFFGIWKI